LGVGKQLLDACLADLGELKNSNLVYLHAQEHAIPFYLKSSFECFGERFFECEIPHYKMKFKA
jgi:predicted GNAT family N-acyltransferase